MTDHRPDHDLPAALRLQLRGLRTPSLPRRDLWPDIAARIAAQTQAAPAQAFPAPRARRRAWPALATAAVLALAVGLGWQLRPEHAATAPLAVAQADAQRAAPPLLVAADAMTREYQGALRELPGVRPASAQYASLVQLDASAEQVRAALAQAPQSQFLLHRLQRIYEHRLSLTQRLAQA